MPVLRSDADVDEAVQRTWVLLFRQRRRASTTAACLPGWLSTTARREALAVLRSQQRAVPTEDVAERVSPVDTDLAADLMRAELSRALERAVETLPATQRRLVRAMLREEQSYDALSRELDDPPGQPGAAARPGGASPARAAGAQPALTSGAGGALGALVDDVLQTLAQRVLHGQVGRGVHGVPELGDEVVVVDLDFLVAALPRG